MNGPVTETQWYIARDGKQHGPLTDVEMRTFVAHNYLRVSDLIWRPGMAEWQPASHAFPAAFAQQPAPVQPHAPAPVQTQHQSAPAMAGTGDDRDAGEHTSDFDDVDEEDDAAPSRGVGRRLATAAAVLAVLGGGAYGLVRYQEPLMALVSGAKPVSQDAADATPTVKAPEETPAESTPQPAAATPGTPTTEATATTPPPPSQPGAVTTADVMANAQGNVPSGGGATETGETKTAALTPPEAAAALPAVDGSDLDGKLQKIPVWALLKQDYHDWYATTVGEAVKMEGEKRPESDVALHLAQGLVALRRQNADKALAASANKLRDMASAFLTNLKALQSKGVSACYGFISKGETSPAIVQLMQNPETATSFNAHVKAVFEAIEEGSKSPATHAAAVKSDYDALIKELGKIGWKEDDLKTFSNPRLLAKQPPDQVCKMVIDWFVAHLAVQDEAVQERLLYETLKPVVTG